jgi:hypothetical protein
MTFLEMYLLSLRWAAAIGLAIVTIVAAVICILVIISLLMGATNESN